jgi:hypothetical protein
MDTQTLTPTEAAIQLLFTNYEARKLFDQYTEEEQTQLRNLFAEITRRMIPVDYFNPQFIEYILLFRDMMPQEICEDFIILCAYSFARFDMRDGIKFIRPYMVDDIAFYNGAVKNFELFKWLNENEYHRILQRGFTPYSEEQEDSEYYLDNRDVFEEAIQGGNVDVCRYMIDKNLFPFATDFLYDYFEEKKKQLKKYNKDMYKFLRKLVRD